MEKKEKEKQIRKEAKATLWAVAAIVVFWFLSGLGVSRIHVTVFHTPLWVITGCLGTWIFAIILTVFLIKKVYRNFDLDDEEGKDE
jgi:uncharacterized membrane protein YhdT